jgi:predicted MPP superfamily phosphohydrolase
MYVLVPMAYLTNPYFHGLYTHPSGAHVYVSAGVNYWGPPVKIYDTNEVTLITLVKG